MSVTFIKKDGNPIEKLGDFHPMKNDQWKRGRSSEKLASFAFQQKEIFEKIIEDVLDDCGLVHQDFIAVPEASSSLGEGMGEGGQRKHDMLLIGQAKSEDKVVIGLEAKVSETFGKKDIGQEMKSQIGKDGDATKTRAFKLMRALTPDENVTHIGYQLFTAVQGTMVAAKRNESTHCIMLVLVFDGVLNSKSGETIEKFNNNRKKNDDDIRDFKDATHSSDDMIVRKVEGEEIHCWIKEKKI